MDSLLIVSMESERSISGTVFQSLIILLKNELNNYYGYVDDENYWNNLILLAEVVLVLYLECQIHLLVSK